ncbi:extracellular solute-binding protein [Oscillibacter sp. MSJ-2]|uniref:Extracellular solute-binding protein n=1 Tax=Dysosmobacter acutus TaxID=2841504 RepID=A0ABS6F7Z5_9FIRM|nr:extracellular solute-binding protein [Dysosmobacter acutus]MBU5626406.1 extracellular solute-binding protein [Dysosmobacter acutus]
MKKRIFLLAALAAGLVLCLAACGETNGDPVTVTLWHVYGGEVNSPMNALVEEFNRTVGQEQNIRVRVDSVSNTNVIHESVLAAAYDDPGASELPDLFISYPKTVLALPDEDILVDYHDYFSDEELDAFLPEFLEEGTVNGRLAVLPIAKSTEILYVNKTAFDRFAAATGASIDDLSTWEGLYALAERYADWSGGKCFFVHDYHFNYFQVGVESLGEDFFDKNGIAFGPKFAYAWEPYARAALTGGLWLGSGYATEPLRTGDAIVSVASSASVLYYSNVVTYPDNSTEQVEIISLPCPTFEGGEKLVMQRGAGLCTVKSSPEREKACMTFLKWLTEPKRNVDFVTELGYMPVTKEGFDDYLPDAIKTLSDPMYVSLYEAFLRTRQDYTFYTPPQREDYLDLETRFEKAVRLRLTAGRAQYLEQGEDTLDTLVRSTMEDFEKNYGK